MRCLIPLVGSLVTAPGQPAVTVERARRHVKALTFADDVLIESWVLAATQVFEEYTGRQVVTATREIWLDAFPGPSSIYSTANQIKLPNPPLQSVSSILYVGDDGSLLSFSDGGSPDTPSYDVKAPQGPYAERGWVVPTFGLTWPTPRIESGAVRVQYVCGYGDTSDDIPDVVAAAICWLVGYFNRYRLPVVDQTNGSLAQVPMVKMMFDSFKFSSYPTISPRTDVGICL